MSEEKITLKDRLLFAMNGWPDLSSYQFFSAIACIIALVFMYFFKLQHEKQR